MSAAIGISHKSKLPLREISGLAVRTMKGRAQLCAIGDDSSTIVTGYLSKSGKVATFRHHRVGAFLDKVLRSEWEAIAADGDGNLFVLQEKPGCVLVLNAALDRLLHRIDLRVTRGAAHTPKGWLDVDSSRGEGLLLLNNGHLLVVKEKNPPLLVEFGPRGSKAEGVAPRLFKKPGRLPLPKSRSSVFVPLQSWSIRARRGRDDLSDLAAFKGKLYMMSDQGRCIVQVESKLPSKGGRARILRRWDLPKSIQKPEGLVFLKRRVPVVAVDSETQVKKQVFVLERLRRRG